jgi:hypothetical protein
MPNHSGFTPSPRSALMCAYRQCPASTDNRIVPNTSRFRGAFGLVYCSGQSFTQSSNKPLVFKKLDEERHLPETAHPSLRRPPQLDFSGKRIQAHGCFRRLARLCFPLTNALSSFILNSIKHFSVHNNRQPPFLGSMIDVVDACASLGIAALGFEESFPYGVSWPPCQAIAREARADGLAGVACRSNGEATLQRLRRRGTRFV